MGEGGGVTPRKVSARVYRRRRTAAALALLLVAGLVLLARGWATPRSGSARSARSTFPASARPPPRVGQPAGGRLRHPPGPARRRVRGRRRPAQRRHHRGPPGPGGPPRGRAVDPPRP